MTAVFSAPDFGVAGAAFVSGCGELVVAALAVLAVLVALLVLEAVVFGSAF